MRILKFSQPNCMPCTMLSNQLTSMGIEVQEYEHDDLPVKLQGVYEVNIFDHMELGRKYNIRTTPHMVAENLFGEKKLELVGNPQPANLELFLTEARDEYKR